MKPFVAVLDYGIGNLRSAQKALNLKGAKAELVDNPEKILSADGIVLPGVGHFGTCMNALVERGLDDTVRKAVEKSIPFLAICVGMQLLYESSQEAPGIPGLQIFQGEIGILPEKVKRPQMQWNKIQIQQPHSWLSGLEDSWMYFVHSFVPPLDEFCIATSNYGGNFPAVVGRDSILATQFHPEKSGEAGLNLIGNFVSSLN